MPGSIRIAKIAGIQVKIHPLWLVIVALITWSLGANYYPAEIQGIAPAAAYVLGFISALLLFVSIVAHEFGHALTARRYGIEIEEIDLWFLGGVAVMKEEPRTWRHEFMFALAGPAVSVGIAGLFGLLTVALAGVSLPALYALVKYQALVNLIIVAFNLLPAFPLDGGRIARAVIWRQTANKYRATKIATRLGKVFAALFIWIAIISLFSGVIGGLWLGVIGLFLLTAAKTEEQQAVVQTALSGRHAGDLMSTDTITIPANITIEEALREYFIPYRFASFPVIDDHGQLVGLISLEQIQAVPSVERSVMLVSRLVDRSQDLFVQEDTDVEAVLCRPAFTHAGRAVVLRPDGKLAGVLSITDVQRALRVLEVTKSNDKISAGIT